jgi:hypothetical protein
MRHTPLRTRYCTAHPDAATVDAGKYHLPDVDRKSSGSEIMLAVPINRNVALVGEIMQFAREGFLKIRSGTSAMPVPQEAARTFDLVALK